MAVVNKKYNDFQGLSEEQTKVAYREYRETSKRFPNKLANVQDMVDHIDHIVKVIGINHVGIGTDFDGGGDLAGCRDVSQMGNVTLELVKRGYSESDIRKIWDGVSKARIAGRFHAGVAAGFVRAAVLARAATGVGQVALSGGCLHNRRLARLLRAGLEAEGFQVFQHVQVSPGDGGLSYGQAAVAAAMLAKRRLAGDAD